MVKIINQVCTFRLELGMFAAYGYYGLTRQWSFLPRVLLTFLLISAAIGLWAVFAAPKSVHRLEMPYLAVFRAAMFLAAADVLFQTGYRNTAMVFAALAITTQAISFFTEK